LRGGKWFSVSCEALLLVVWTREGGDARDKKLRTSHPDEFFQ
jgi:hypothetical protein